MLRSLHSLPGLIAGLLVALLAITGAVLSINPAWDRLEAPATQAISVADLAGTVAKTYPGVERIVQKASGAVIVYYFKGDVPGADLVDPATGQSVDAYEPSAFTTFVTDLHRSLFLGTGGRVAAGVGALAMVLLTLSGAFLLAARLGGWAKLFRPVRGSGWQRLHAEIGRFAILGLLLSSLTAAYMSATTFSIIPDGMASDPAVPTNVDGGTPSPVGNLAGLKAIPLADLRELTFPYADDPTDVFTVTTSTGTTFVDQATGTQISVVANSLAQQIYEFVFMLHTGQGLWWLALILGLSAVAAPVMAVSGALIWWARRRAKPRFAHNARPAAADTVILVGSEGNSTWGFARTLHDALAAAGHCVHTTSMNRFGPQYGAARRLIILTATYGDGAAPASGRDFLSRLDAFQGRPGFATAVLGFGDRQFPQFCQFARDVDAALAARLWPELLPLDSIDRQSAPEFSRWGTRLGEVLGIDLHLDHHADAPRTLDLELVERIDYGREVQAPTTIFRFALPGQPTGNFLTRLFRAKLPRFEAGDLVGILPPGSMQPRYYSLASASRHGVLEICVRKQAGGLCSTFLHGLVPGGRIAAFVKPNPAFRPQAGAAPVVLIGAGTGIGPLTGFIRNNSRRQPMHLYFGSRDPASDYLYETDLMDWLAKGQLTRLRTAFSRIARKSYVQDQLLADGDQLRALISHGAQVMVCGGRDMAHGVRDAIERIIAPLGLDTAHLKAKGLYLEDVY